MRSFVNVALMTFALTFTEPGFAQEVETDPRQGDVAYERSEALFGAIRDVLEDAAEARSDMDGEGAVSGFLRRRLGADAQTRAQDLLGSAFEVVTEADAVQIQQDIAAKRAAIRDLRAAIARLREDRIAAPVDAGLRGTLGLVKDREAIDAEIAEAESRVGANEAAISDAKAEFRTALSAVGVTLSAEQTDLLLDSVTGDDVVKLAAAYQAARAVDAQLLALMDQSGEEIGAAKRYYGMHAALIALLVHAQTAFVDKVDGDYLPKLAAIERDIDAARRETERLLGDNPTAQQKKALEANLQSQRVAKDAAEFYRQHLNSQRVEIAEARAVAVKELRVADNTLRTVEASFQLRALMESATMGFDALKSLEIPGVERFFQNEQLRREFQELSDRLQPVS